MSPEDSSCGGVPDQGHSSGFLQATALSPYHVRLYVELLHEMETDLTWSDPRQRNRKTKIEVIGILEPKLGSDTLPFLPYSIYWK